MRKDQSLDKHMRDLRIALDELIVLGENLSELDYSLQIVGSLPPSWRPFIGTITWRLDRKKDDETKVYASDLLARIMEEERRRSGALTNTPETSMYTRNVDKPNIECSNCKRKGHIASDC